MRQENQLGFLTMQNMEAVVVTQDPSSEMMDEVVASSKCIEFCSWVVALLTVEKTHKANKNHMYFLWEVKMQIGDIISFGCYDWRVLDLQHDKALLITESIVEQRAYHDARQDITWAGCALRYYLNGEFYRSFTEEEQARILPVLNITPDNEWYDSPGGADTKDRIFLLSMEEVVCRCFGDSSRNLYHPGRKQKYWFQRKDENNSRRMATFKSKEWWWWLRTPGRHGRKAVYVHGDGNIGIQGNGTFNYNSNIIHPLGDNRGGVRPALWLKLS